jgi:sulfite reductase (ferredoxin)
MNRAEESRFAEPLKSEIASIRDQIARFQRGEIPPEKFRALRLVNGIYGQRQPDVHMIRVKIPNGVLDPQQIDVLAEIAENHGHGIAHVTTRQDVQFHYIPLVEVPAVLERLAKVGLMSREACGNSVRNVTSCPLSGVCRDEPFAVLPYAQAVARYLLRHPTAQLLGRKFKIAFSGCESDCAAGAIHDIGAIATVRGANGRAKHGFRILAGGGLGPTPYVAQLVDEFVPANEILESCEALVRLFSLHGNRKNRSAARSKFIVAKWGIDKFRAEYQSIRSALRSTHGNAAELAVETYLKPEEIALLEAPAPAAHAPSAKGNGHDAESADPRLARWIAANTVHQRQAGLVAVTIALPLGDLNGEQLRAISALMRSIGTDDARATIQQNLLLRSVPIAALPDVYFALEQIGLANAAADTALDVTSCPGADTCNLGITSSRGLARAILAEMESAGIDAMALHGERIKISGCPNGCGQHHTASIGFHGVARKIDARQAPFYQMHLGGKVVGEGSRLAKGSVDIPAKNAPAATREIVKRYVATRREGEGLADFLGRTSTDEVRSWLQGLLERPLGEAFHDAGFKDWGRDEIFTTQTLGTGECAGAGMDLSVDPFEEAVLGLREAELFLEHEQVVDSLTELNRAVIAAARVVLAQGVGKETITDWETLCEFNARLFDRGHVSSKWRHLRDEIDSLFGTRVVPEPRVRALVPAVHAFLAEARAVLEALRRWKADPAAAALPGLSGHGSGEVIG